MKRSHAIAYFVRVTFEVVDGVRGILAGVRPVESSRSWWARLAWRTLRGRPPTVSRAGDGTAVPEGFRTGRRRKGARLGVLVGAGGVGVLMRGVGAACLVDTPSPVGDQRRRLASAGQWNGPQGASGGYRPHVRRPGPRPADAVHAPCPGAGRGPGICPSFALGVLEVGHPVQYGAERRVQGRVRSPVPRWIVSEVQCADRAFELDRAVEGRRAVEAGGNRERTEGLLPPLPPSASGLSARPSLRALLLPGTLLLIAFSARRSSRKPVPWVSGHR
ncbi:hypothetical protein NKH18_06500 [Streptomyces sp. M10(2022)]